MSERNGKSELEEIELELLLEGLYQHYGVDLRDYARAALRQCLRGCMEQEQTVTISGYQEKVLHDQESLERLLVAISYRSAAMFRDPAFYLSFRAKVVPLLRTYPFARLWFPACSTGEEVYSVAILLEEEGLYQRCRIYATDMSREMVKRAKEGLFPLAAVRDYTSNYLRAGGKRFLSDYYTPQRGLACFNHELKRNLIFSEHNLVTDGSFNEFHVVLCRNVMISFNRRLQERVHELIYESLSMFGVVGLGNRESLRLSPREAFFDVLDDRQRLYRKVM